MIGPSGAVLVMMAEMRDAFRNLVDCIIVHPVRKRMPYEYTPYLNAAALFSMKLFSEDRHKTGTMSTA
ncbi:hypothetical protein CWO89_14055 [Bradyrhizobium sp. Leo170]|nr:hypothetical protein CWO89_14055 [Bradyrhizobium sp. Leo170]